MASSLYIGPPGVGKTTALVRYVILPALERGQRVVTNVPLVQPALEAHLKVSLDGLIRLVTSEEIKSPAFWFTAQGVGETITQPGDVICVDECHEFYGADQKIKSDAEVFRAVRLQRKYTGGKDNFSTSIVFATQLFGDMSRSLREVCDSMYYMQKLTVVGKPDSYRVDIFSDCRKSPTRATPVNSLFGTYDPAYFALYNSYSTGVGGFSSSSPGVETVTDGRLNFWDQPIGWGPFKVKMRTARRGAIIFGVLMLFSLFGVFSYAVKSAMRTATGGAPLEAAEAPAPLLDGPSSPVARATPVPVLPPEDDLRKDESREYRLVGLYSIGALPVAVIADREGTYRYLAQSFDLVRAGPASHIVFRGKIIAPWTGAQVAIQGGKTPIQQSR